MLCVRLSFAALNITCEFSIDEGKYTVKLTNQSFKATDRGVKIYGRHINRSKNTEVLILDASNRGNNLELPPAVLFQIFINLIEIRMEKCGLKALNADTFKYCRNIQKMKFGYDEMEIEDSVFKTCKKLEILEFNNNNFKKISSNALDGLENLKKLKMSSCNLQEMEPSLFLPLLSLEEINLSGNKIKEIPTTALEDMSQLRIMNFSNNHLLTFKTALLAHKPFLKQVDLSRNHIITLEPHMLENWQNNAALNLESNVCVDRNFGYIGTSDEPLIDVVAALKDCLQDQKSSVNVTKVSSMESKGNSESLESILGEVENNEPEKQNLMKINDEQTVNMKSTNGSEEIKFGDNLQVVPIIETLHVMKDEGNVEDMTDSPFEFFKDSWTKFSTLPPTSPENSQEESKQKVSEESLESTSAPVKLNKTGNESNEQQNSSSKEVFSSPFEIFEGANVKFHDYEQAACRFYIDADKNYNCELNGVTNQLKQINVEHLHNRTNTDVNGVYFRNSKLFQVPKVIIHTFPNLVLLSIEKTNLKVMDDEFLEECGTIKKINLRQNKIRRVEKNSLKACSFLEEIDLSQNPIETIEGGIFESNTKVNFVFNDLRILPVRSSDNEEDKDGN